MNEQPRNAVEQIREFADSVENPDNWMITVPEADYDAVKAQLETVYDTGTYYHGIALCYTPEHDSVHVEYKSEITEHLEKQCD